MQTFMVSTCTSMYDRCAVFFFFSMRCFAPSPLCNVLAAILSATES